MHTYVLIHNATSGVDLNYFKSERDDLNHLSFGGEEFDAELTKAQRTKKSMTKYLVENPKWAFVHDLIEKFGIDFSPYNEDILIDMVPDDIEVIPL